MHTKDEIELLEYLKNYEIKYQDHIGGFDIPFGCEIEFENASHELIRRKLCTLFLKENIRNWQLKNDISLNEYKTEEAINARNIYGGEIVSPILNDRLECWIELKKICELLRKNNAKNIGKSGAHIHFDSTIFKNHELILRILKLWCVYEDVIYRFSMGFDEHLRPAIGQYAMPVSNIIKDVLNCKYSKDYDRLMRQLKTSKNFGISFYNFGKSDKDTIEIKTPNGTVDEVVWQNNVNFFKHFLLSTIDRKVDWDLIEYRLNNHNYNLYNLSNYESMNIKRALELSDFIYDEEKDKLNFMKQYTKIK